MCIIYSQAPLPHPTPPPPHPGPTSIFWTPLTVPQACWSALAFPEHWEVGLFYSIDEESEAHKLALLMGFKETNNDGEMNSLVIATQP